MSDERTWTVSAECRACKGTGLYVGMAERSGAAVVCHTCEGTGCETITVKYRPFIKRQPRHDVTRVYRVNPGIMIGTGNGHRLEDFGGIPHAAWEAGAPFTDGTEDRRHTCPAWFYQSADYSRKPNWKECGFGAFSTCNHFPNKDACWRRFDAEQGTVQLERRTP
jgi:hypothetical protein